MFSFFHFTIRISTRGTGGLGGGGNNKVKYWGYYRRNSFFCCSEEDHSLKTSLLKERRYFWGKSNRFKSKRHSGIFSSSEASHIDRFSFWWLLFFLLSLRRGGEEERIGGGRSRENSTSHYNEQIRNINNYLLFNGRLLALLCFALIFTFSPFLSYLLFPSSLFRQGGTAPPPPPDYPLCLSISLSFSHSVCPQLSQENPNTANTTANANA